MVDVVLPAWALPDSQKQQFPMRSATPSLNPMNSNDQDTNFWLQTLQISRLQWGCERNSQYSVPHSPTAKREIPLSATSLAAASTGSSERPFVIRTAIWVNKRMSWWHKFQYLTYKPTFEYGKTWENTHCTRSLHRPTSVTIWLINEDVFLSGIQGNLLADNLPIKGNWFVH